MSQVEEEVQNRPASEMEEELQNLNYEANEEEDAMGGGDQCCYTRQVITPPSRPMTGEPGQFGIGIRGKSVMSPESTSSVSVSAGGFKCIDVSPSHSVAMLEERIREDVYKKWKKIQTSCLKLDNRKVNSVTCQEFSDVLKQHGIELTITEARDLTAKYQVRGNPSNIHYKNFLKHFLLTLRSRDEGMLERKIIHSSRIPLIFGKESDQFCDVMLRLRGRLLHCWKEMRRTFRTHDLHAIGVVSPATFRNVLAEYSIVLNEEDFFNLMSYYDHAMLGRVPYNEFLRAFLRN